MYRTEFWTLWEKVRVGCLERTALKRVYYIGWNRSPAQAGCMRQVLGPGALERPRGIGWRGRWEGGSGWGIHVNLWLIHVNVWQKPLQYCTVISLQLIKINEEKKSMKLNYFNFMFWEDDFTMWDSSLHIKHIHYNFSLETFSCYFCLPWSRPLHILKYLMDNMKWSF